MSVIMDKELLVRVPSPLYAKVKRLCKNEYKSISGLVRELLLEEVEESLKEEDLKIIVKERKNFYKGKGISWRKVKRG